MRFTKMRRSLRTFLIALIFVYIFIETSEAACYNNKECRNSFQGSNSKCIGRYCGRSYNSETGEVTSDGCGACPRGFRTDHYVCVPCTQTISSYSIAYLTFMTTLVVTIQYYATITTTEPEDRAPAQISMVIETIVSMLLSVLCFEPQGSLKLYSCVEGTDGGNHRSIKDWYTPFYNPSYTYCASEAVYPLWTLIMVFFGFCAALVVLVRSILLRMFIKPKNGGTSSLIYFVLYLFPGLTVAQVIFGGLIYYAFPYLVLAVTLVGDIAFFVTRKGEMFEYPMIVHVGLRYIGNVFAIVSIIFFFNASWLFLILAFLGPAMIPLLLFAISRCCK